MIPLIALLTMAAGRPSFAQVDVSGEWGSTFHEDLPLRGGMRLGDYTGLPLNEAGWRKAQSWDEAARSTPERQCIPHVVTVVEDPRYLNQPFLTSTHFKQEPDASKWAPTPCEKG